MVSSTALTWLPAGAAFFGAIIGSGLSYLANRRSADIAEKNATRSDLTERDLKITDYRVEWIQSLRNEMAFFQSWGMTPGIDQTLEREFYEHGTRIELLMNPNDEDFEELKILMYQLLIAKETEEKYSVNTNYVHVCQRILKREWEVAKGEIRKNSQKK